MNLTHIEGVESLLESPPPGALHAWSSIWELSMGREASYLPCMPPKQPLVHASGFASLSSGIVLGMRLAIWGLMISNLNPVQL